MGKTDYMKYYGRNEEPPYNTEAAPSSCTVDSIVVPRELWERMRQAIFRISCGREVCAGSPAYDPGLCDKAAVDKLVEDIQRHNSTTHRVTLCHPERKTMDTDKDAGRVAIESTQLLASKLQRLLVFWGDDAKRERPGSWTRVLLEKHIDEVKSILSEANI